MTSCEVLFLAIAFVFGVAAVQALLGKSAFPISLGGILPPGGSEPGDLRLRGSLPAQPVRAQGHLGFALIREHDPAFSVDAFYEEVSRKFTAVRHAVANGNMTGLHNIVGPEAYAWIERRAADGPRGLVAGGGEVKVERVNATTVLREGDRDIVRVRIHAHGPGGDGFQEYWKLERGTATTTRPDAGIFKCANCGGPVDGADPLHCGYCGARLDDPELDWVVTEIQED
jgi:hypothetical protein